MKARTKEAGSTLRRRLLNGSMAAALVAAVAVFCVMLQIEKNTLADYEKGVIYVAAREIPKGQIISQENVSEYFAECLLDLSCIPEAAVTDVSKLRGMAARVPVEEGAFLCQGMFEELDEITAGMQEPVIAGLKAEDLYQVVGGVLRSGDRVHIYRVNQEGRAVLVWENLFVQAVFDQAGTVIRSGDEATAAQRINVYLDKGDVEEFYSELTLGTLRMVKAEDV